MAGLGVRGIAAAHAPTSLELVRFQMLTGTGDEDGMKAYKNYMHLRVFIYLIFFEINPRVSTTCNAKHMSLTLNLTQCMEMFITIRGTQESVTGIDY